MRKLVFPVKDFWRQELSTWSSYAPQKSFQNIETTAINLSIWLSFRFGGDGRDRTNPRLTASQALPVSIGCAHPVSLFLET